MTRALPALAFLTVLVVNAETADHYQSLQPESVRTHLYLGLAHALLAWAVVRAALWVIWR